MDWRVTTEDTAWYDYGKMYRNVYAYEPIQYEGSASQIARQTYRTVAENLKVFIRELTKEIENGTLVFNEKEMEDRIEKLFCDQV